MSFATWNFLKIYARIRESYLRLNPRQRLIPDYDPSDDDSAFITVGEKGKKIGVLVVALVVLLLLSNRE